MSDEKLPTTSAPLDQSDLGPACLKLSARHLRFAFALCSEVSGPDAAEAAAIIAGFPGQAQDRTKFRTDARKLSHSPGIIAALEELGRQRLSLDLPLALETLRNAMQDRFGKDKIKAAQVLLDRVLPTKTEVKLTTDKLDITGSAIAHLRHLRDVLKADHAVLVREFGAEGLIRWTALEIAQEKAKPITVEYEVIEKPAEPSAPVHPESAEIAALEEEDFNEVSLEDELEEYFPDETKGLDHERL